MSDISVFTLLNQNIGIRAKFKNCYVKGVL